MSDTPPTPHATSRPRAVARRLFALATSLPAMAFLACALLVDALLLPRESACCLLRGTRRSWHVDSVWLVRTEGTLHPVLSDQEDAIYHVGIARLPARISLDHCFWAPILETTRVEIIPSLDDNTAPTHADLVSIGRDLAELRAGNGADTRIVELLRRGGGSERRLLPLGCVHNAAAATSALLILCGLVGGIRSEVRSSLERRRVGRDQCPNCGYPRAGGPPGPCPECGQH